MVNFVEVPYCTYNYSMYIEHREREREGKKKGTRYCVSC
jgi:hypothetical protein